jgi:hypothetical protein
MLVARNERPSLDAFDFLDGASPEAAGIVAGAVSGDTASIRAISAGASKRFERSSATMPAATRLP